MSTSGGERISGLSSGPRAAQREGGERGKVVVPEDAAAFLSRSRVARLATAGSSGSPHVIPVCFSVAPGARRIYIALDEKPKSVDVRRLKRVRNILENPYVALTADHYSEDWSHLAFAMVKGAAALLEPETAEHAAAIRLLRGKYRQYEQMKIEASPVISITPEKVAVWGDLSSLSGGDTTGTPLLEGLRGRRSVRRYLDLGVPDEKVERVLEAARWAPSPHGTQPYRLAVMRSPQTKSRIASAMGEAWTRNLEMDEQPDRVVQKRLDGSRKRLMDAPVLILVCLYTADLDHYPDEKRQRDEETMAVQSLGSATQNMLLAAYDEGLDTGWMCAPLFTPETVVKALGLGEDLVPHALITLGYADGDPPKRRPKRSLHELVVYRD
ncbi:MAG: TIGR03668 family PPOX class F420-dependent oxidoreductase [Rubrobacter sp.]